MKTSEEWTPEQHNTAIRRKIEQIKKRVPFEISDMNEIASLQDDLLTESTPGANDALAGIRERLAKITTGQWMLDPVIPKYSAPEIISGALDGKRRVAKCLLDTGSEGITAARANADFIVHAPDDIATLIAALAAANEREAALERELSAVRNEYQGYQDAAQTRITELRDGVSTPDATAPTRETPDGGPFAAMYADMGKAFAGQHLHCNECGREQALSVDEAATFMRLGWPKCYGREMAVVKDTPPAPGAPVAAMKLTDVERDWLQAAVDCDSLSFADRTPAVKRIFKGLYKRGLMASFTTMDARGRTKWYTATPLGRVALADATGNNHDRN